MRTTPVDRLAHLGRALLLVGALLALATAALWTQGKDWIKEFDARTVDDYITEARALDVRAQALPGSQSAQIVELFEQVAELVQEVRPGERMENERRHAMAYLARHRGRIGDHAGALEAAREWVEFDPRNVQAALELDGLLAGDPDLAVERRELLGKLFERLPDVAEVAAAWCGLLMDEGFPLEAVEAALLTDRQARPNLWRIRWKRREAAPTPFQALVVPRLTAEGELVLECSLAGPALWFSIELPPGGACTLVDPVVTISKRGAEQELRLADLEGLKAFHLKREGRSFTQAGSLGARFEFEPGDAARAPQPHLTFRAGYLRPPAAGLLAVALHPHAGLAFEVLRASGREADLARLTHARLTGLVQGELQLYWRKKKGGFTAANSVRVPVGGEPEGSQLSFDLEFPIGERVSLVRLDLPEGRGVTYELSEVEVALAEGALAEGAAVIDLATYELEFLHSIERAGDHFLVTGKDPWMAFELSGPVRTVESLRLRGVAR